jgi:hypothetical protein
METAPTPEKPCFIKKNRKWEKSPQKEEYLKRHIAKFYVLLTVNLDTFV